MMRDPTFSDLRLAHAIMLGPCRFEPWSRYKHRASKGEADAVRKVWWDCIRQAVRERTP